MRTDMVTFYVRQLSKDMTGTRPEPDEDGDLPIRHRGSCFYLHVLAPQDPYVQVFSIAVSEVAESLELLHELNTINASLHCARAFHVNG